MFTIVDANNRADHSLDLQIFSQKTQSAASVVVTPYDHQDSIYLLFQDPATGLKGRARLNPMTRPNLIKETLGDRVKAYEQPYIWECSALSFEGGMPPSHALYKAFVDALETVRARFHMGLILFLQSAHEIRTMKNMGHMSFQTVLPLDRQGHQCLALFQSTYRH